MSVVPSGVSPKLRVLIVEDNPDDADLLVRHLRNGGGYEIEFERVETLESMSEALERKEWDLIISDYSMPAFSAPAALQNWVRHSIDVPFIVVTATIGEEKAVDLMRHGAHDFLLKENLQRLVPAVQRELREAANRRRKREVEAERLKLLEELKEQVRVREEFLSIASHELMTPLTPMRLGNETLQILLAKEPPDPAVIPKARVAVARSAEQIERLIRLAEQLLDVSRIRSGVMELEFAEEDLAKTVTEIVDSARPQAEASKCALEVKISGPLPGRFDSLRIGEVMANLLGNAIKYGAGKAIQVSLSGDRERAKLTVRDAGLGIAEKDQERIFERFERAVSSDHYGGLGLGLYISRQIVQAHGGTIRVESTPGKGALFEVELPLNPGNRK